MNAPLHSKPNCWDYLKCGQGPDSPQPCLVATEDASDGVNGGWNGGRFCWALAGTLSGGEYLASCATKARCLNCDFLHLVKSQEGESFQLLKLALGVRDAGQLRSTIAQVESLVSIHERLRSRFDLDTTIRQITHEARKVTGAQRSMVLLVKGRPPALHGEFTLRGKLNKVVMHLDETSAVGFVARRNQMVNLRDIYEGVGTRSVPVFDRTFDRQSRCKTHSFLAVPVCDSAGRVIGVITAVNAKKGFFSSDDEWFMEKYATEVALGVEKQKFIQQTMSALRLASIGETIAGFSHCMKNIAQALRAGSHVIKRALESNNLQNIRVAWELVDRHIERLAELSVDVLAYDPAVQEHSERGSLNDLVGHVVDLFEEEARARAVDLSFDGGERVGRAKFDPMGIYRCLVNLVGNALDACPLSHGVVKIATKRTGQGEFMISVSDNGHGISEEAKAAVFEAFHTSKLRDGTGLGLPTVADIVEKHNGRIELESELGKGTTFKVFIREDVALA